MSFSRQTHVFGARNGGFHETHICAGRMTTAKKTSCVYTIWLRVEPSERRNRERGEQRGIMQVR